VLANDRHPQVRAVVAPQALGQGVAQEASPIRPAPHLAEQRFPLAARGAVLVPVGARVLPPVVEELHVLALQRLDLALDEGVEFDQETLDLRGDSEVHVSDHTPGQPARVAGPGTLHHGLGAGSRIAPCHSTC